MNIEIQELTKDVSVKCDIGVIPIKGTYKEIGYFKASGEYKSGSAGSEDAKHIRGMMAYAVESYYQNFWILDLTELVYDWGDEMDWVLSFDEFEGVEIVATIFGPKCIEAVATLGGMHRKPSDLLNESGNFNNLQKAYEYLLPKIT